MEPDRLTSLSATSDMGQLRRTQCEHMFSALPSNSDIARCSRHVSNVPNPEVAGRWTAPGAPKSEIQFSCVGGLLTYISFTPRNVSECAADGRRSAGTSVHKRLRFRDQLVPVFPWTERARRKRCVDRMIRTGAFVPPAERERIRLKPSAPVRA